MQLRPSLCLHVTQRILRHSHLTPPPPPCCGSWSRRRTDTAVGRLYLTVLLPLLLLLPQIRVTAFFFPPPPPHLLVHLSPCLHGAHGLPLHHGPPQPLDGAVRRRLLLLGAADLVAQNQALRAQLLAEVRSLRGGAFKGSMSSHQEVAARPQLQPCARSFRRKYAAYRVGKQYLVGTAYLIGTPQQSPSTSHLAPPSTVALHGHGRP